MTQTLTSTPAADGFWMPAEFEPHAGCWMLWPERADNWREAARPAQQLDQLDPDHDGPPMWSEPVPVTASTISSSVRW